MTSCTCSVYMRVAGESVSCRNMKNRNSCILQLMPHTVNSWLAVLNGDGAECVTHVKGWEAACTSSDKMADIIHMQKGCISSLHKWPRMGQASKWLSTQHFVHVHFCPKWYMYVRLWQLKWRQISCSWSCKLVGACLADTAPPLHCLTNIWTLHICSPGTKSWNKQCDVHGHFQSILCMYTICILV